MVPRSTGWEQMKRKTQVSVILAVLWIVLTFTSTFWTSSIWAGTLSDFTDPMTIRSEDPIEIWRLLRPQDFVKAPTVWQILV